MQDDKLHVKISADYAITTQINKISGNAEEALTGCTRWNTSWGSPLSAAVRLEGAELFPGLIFTFASMKCSS